VDKKRDGFIAFSGRSAETKSRCMSQRGLEGEDKPAKGGGLSAEEKCWGFNDS